MHADTTKVISTSPRIILSDHRYEGAPCFLYLPDDRRDMVFVDHFSNVQSIASWPVWRQEVTQHTGQVCHRVQPIPGKGMGVVAARAIAEGELILAERPIWAGRSRLSCAADQTSMNGIFYRAAIRDLSTRSRTAFLELANSYPAAEYDIVPGILNTNCLAINLPKYCMLSDPLAYKP